MSNDDRSKVVILSDIHIGDNSKTCWYQKKYHEPYLFAALDYIKQNAELIDEVILLGDVFDFWAYPCAAPPPSFSKIVQANPDLLGPSGKLAEVASLLPDRIVYINGNHDQNVRQDDIRQLGQIRYCSSLQYVKTDHNHRILFTHGHEYAIFNALDQDTPLAPLPIGHFVTRAIAEHVNRILPPGKTAADMKDGGTPFDYAIMLAAIIEALKQPPFSITKVLLDYITSAAGVPKNTAVSLLDSRQATYNQAEEYYANLAANWIARYGGGERGLIAVIKSVTADHSGNYIAWYAQRDALQSEISAELAILGHTHRHRLGLKEAMINYINSGFMCPPIIDGQPQYPITFAEADLRGCNISLKSVVKQSDAYQVVDISGQSPSDSVVYSPAQDYSCYVSILNNSSSTLSKTGGETEVHGYYVVPPPQTISPGNRAQFWIHDFPGVEGAGGNVSYTDQANGKTTTFKYACPLIMNNNCGPKPFQNKSGSGDWSADQVVGRGHPYFVNFFIKPAEEVK
jgi:UDP-2,3-diacylglucosamine pyrophosphatase LpxH